MTEYEITALYSATECETLSPSEVNAIKKAINILVNKSEPQMTIVSFADHEDGNKYIIAEETTSIDNAWRTAIQALTSADDVCIVYHKDYQHIKHSWDVIKDYSINLWKGANA